VKEKLTVNMQHHLDVDKEEGHLLLTTGGTYLLLVDGHPCERRKVATCQQKKDVHRWQ